MKSKKLKKAKEAYENGFKVEVNKCGFWEYDQNPLWIEDYKYRVKKNRKLNKRDLEILTNLVNLYDYYHKGDLEQYYVKEARALRYRVRDMVLNVSNKR